MAWAANDQISSDPIKGGIELTDDQYAQALDEIARGNSVRVVDGVLDFVPRPGRSTYWLAPRDRYETAPGEEPPADAVLSDPPTDYHVIESGQWVEDQARKTQWFSDAIEARADRELGQGINYTASDGVTYTIRTGPTARALIAGVHSAAERADRLSNAITRKVPTQSHGVVSFGNADLTGIFEAVEALHQGTATQKGIMDRVDELNALVADGTITESDLDTGWP